MISLFTLFLAPWPLTEIVEMLTHRRSNVGEQVCEIKFVKWWHHFLQTKYLPWPRLFTYVVEMQTHERRTNNEMSCEVWLHRPRGVIVERNYWRRMSIIAHLEQFMHRWLINWGLKLFLTFFSHITVASSPTHLFWHLLLANRKKVGRAGILTHNPSINSLRRYWLSNQGSAVHRLA